MLKRGHKVFLHLVQNSLIGLFWFAVAINIFLTWMSLGFEFISDKGACVCVCVFCKTLKIVVLSFISSGLKSKELFTIKLTFE